MEKILFRPNIDESLVNLKHDNKLYKRIMNYDLQIITETFARRNPQYASQAKILEIECKRFLYLALIAPNFELAPTKPIDEYWHCFILFTKEYESFCLRFGGYFIHHKPLGADEHEIVFNRTQNIVTKLFGKFENHDLWFLPMPATSCCSARSPQRPEDLIRVMN